MPLTLLAGLTFLFLARNAVLCAEVPATPPPPPSSFTYYLFSAVIAACLAKLLWDQRRHLSEMMKKAAARPSTNANSTSNNNNISKSNTTAKVNDLEAKVENLQKTLRDKDHAIAELKDKNVKQEKKIDAQTRAKSAKEKDASVKELKERILQQQKKDDVTRARLATPDSPVVKAVLDATLQENKDLHLRIEAMVQKAQEEQKTVSDISRIVENYKQELVVAETRNMALEQELQAAKAETLRIQRQIAHLRDPVSPSHFVSHAAPTTEISSPTANTIPAINTSPNAKTDSNNTESTPQSQPTTPRTSSSPEDAQSKALPSAPAHTQLKTSHVKPVITLPSTEPTSPRTNGITTTTTDDPATITSTTSTSTSPPVTPRDTLAELESYDLSKLAKELDADTLGSASLSDLMDSLDNGSPMQALDFISLAQDKTQSSQSSGLMSPTARVEMRSPFKDEHDYDKDFISMFSPPGNNQIKKVRNNPDLNNLFYTEDKPSSPPTFNLEGIDKDFLVSNDQLEPELSSPRSQPQLISQPPVSPSAVPPPSFALHRSGSTSPPPNNHDDFPTRAKGAHKSIFSVFGNDNAGTEPHATPSPPPTNNPTIPSGVAPTPHDELVLSFGSKVDTNKAGLRRAKKVNFAAFAKGKVKVEPTMEDVHFCIYPYMKSKSRALFAVFDGHAGRAAADEAAALFPKEFNTQLDAASQDVRNAFMKTYATVDEAMKEYEYMGTTATVVYLWQKEGRKYLQASNVGDSTAFLCRNGVAVRLTIDHKPSVPEEKERMRLAGIEVSDNQTRINGLAVSRSLGNHFVKEQNIGMIATPYVGECIEILPTDTHLIVASDGLWDVISPQHAMDMINGMEGLPAASTLLSTALAHNKCNDNVTIIVARLN